MVGTLSSVLAETLPQLVTRCVGIWAGRHDDSIKANHESSKDVPPTHLRQEVGRAVLRFRA